MSNIHKISNHEAYHLPEFKALCAALGIPWKTPTIGLVIRIGSDPDGLVEITHEYTGHTKIENGIVDTTTLNNETYRTKRPCQHQS